MWHTGLASVCDVTVHLNEAQIIAIRSEQRCLVALSNDSNSMWTTTKSWSKNRTSVRHFTCGSVCTFTCKALPAHGTSNRMPVLLPVVALATVSSTTHVYSSLLMNASLFMHVYLTPAHQDILLSGLQGSINRGLNRLQTTRYAVTDLPRGNSIPHVFRAP